MFARRFSVEPVDAEGAREAGHRVPLDRLQPALEDWCRRKGYLKAGERLLSSCPLRRRPIKCADSCAQEDYGVFSLQRLLGQEFRFGAFVFPLYFEQGESH